MTPPSHHPANQSTTDRGGATVSTDAMPPDIAFATVGKATNLATKQHQATDTTDAAGSVASSVGPTVPPT
eukprot:CAMPEP_0119516514 /NCGR_PEP_ID=MMETSP1344-20130328/33695_1 /TAXON_ID=236787 /ORGANISM="Florenciella parvula, Strain CCMP2471" /LENGTH=69 /DNA_ID=CAMNT_0007554021 /DNA_START=133 /DNA_END=343 /DNA_ORIENTATION=-